MSALLAALLVIGVVSMPLHDPQDSLSKMMKDVQTIVDGRAAAYNCTFSVALRTPSLGSLKWASGEDSSTDDTFAWGSITKMWTGASVMQLVAAGKLKLDEAAAPYIDAQLAAMKKIDFPGMNFTRLSDLFGEDVNKVTIRNLLAMQSGVPDFDTANPSRFGKDTDKFRATVYANPTKDYLEPDLLTVPWVATHKLEFAPGQGFHYSSTNFGLLGLLLSHHAATADYREFNQSAFIPESLADVVGEITWASRGSPRDHGVVAGYDRTDYNGQDPKSAGVPVVDVHGVFAGWSASDFIGPASAVADLGYALWGNSSTLVPAHYRDMMVPKTTGGFTDRFYGLAAQNVGLIGITGQDGADGVAYGHLGATYGYDSIFAYNPGLDLALSIATNIETGSQTQPADAFCGVYNRIRNYMQGGSVENCAYATSGYYGGKCKCK